MKQNKQTLLKGQNNLHTLYGNFSVTTEDEYQNIEVKETSLLKHEIPSGAKAEHETLEVQTGNWVTGKQVEWNPFNREISLVWD